MAKTVQTIAALSSAATLVSLLLYQAFGTGPLLSLSITLATTAYHFVMRLLVGWAANAALKNQADHRRAWFRPRPFEAPLYRALKVKAWKGRLPSYDPTLFSPRCHTLEEVAGAMCQAELVHEAIVALSFLPLAMVPVFGALPVFLLTSLAAACFDLLFVILQRYNRPRIVRLLARRQARLSR